jgi:hypothetical protein
MELKRADLLRRLSPGLGVAASLVIFRLAASPEAISGTAHALVIVALVVAAVVLVWIPGIAVASLVARKVPESLLPAVTACGSAAAGWLLFWAWFANPGAGRIATYACAALSSIVLALRPRGTLRTPAIAAPLLLALLIAVAYVALAGDHGGLAGGADMIAHRYWVSVDNKIPQFFADGLINHHHGLKPLIGEWQSSDRPPLQTGMLMTAYPIAPVDGRLLAALVLGVAANMLWVFGLWSVLRCLRFRAATASLIVIAVALAGPIYINSVYTWPKMLAGGLTLCALAAALDQDLGAGLRAVLGGAAVGLALLAHGSALPAVMAIALLLVLPGRYRVRPRTLLLAGLVVVAVYSPWLGYQRFYNPPGDRLVKWHLAGDPAPTNKSSLHTILHAYKVAGLDGTMRNKLQNVRMLVGDPTTWDRSTGAWNTGWTQTRIGRLRFYLLARLGPAPGLLLLGLLALARRRIRRRPWVPPLSFFVAVSTLIYILMEFGGSGLATTWLFTSPYAVLLALCALGVAAVAELGTRWIWGLVLVQLVAFVGLWVVHVSLQSAYAPSASDRLDVSLDVVAGAAFCAITALAAALGREHHAPAQHIAIVGRR